MNGISSACKLRCDLVKARARVNPTIAVALVQGPSARHCSKTAGHLKLATTPEERKHSTTPLSITFQQFPKTTLNQHHCYLTSRYHPPAIKLIPHHADCTSSHNFVNGSFRSPRCIRRAASYTSTFSHQHQHSTDRRNVERTDIDQPPSSAVRPGDAL